MRETPAIQIQLEVSWGPKVYLLSFTRVNYRPPGWKLTLLFHVLVNLVSAYLGLPPGKKKYLSLDVSAFYNWPDRTLSREIGVRVMKYDIAWHASQYGLLDITLNFQLRCFKPKNEDRVVFFNFTIKLWGGFFVACAKHIKRTEVLSLSKSWWFQATQLLLHMCGGWAGGPLSGALTENMLCRCRPEPESWIFCFVFWIRPQRRFKKLQ